MPADGVRAGHEQIDVVQHGCLIPESLCRRESTPVDERLAGGMVVRYSWEGRRLQLLAVIPFLGGPVMRAQLLAVLFLVCLAGNAKPPATVPPPLHPDEVSVERDDPGPGV